MWATAARCPVTDAENQQLALFAVHSQELDGFDQLIKLCTVPFFSNQCSDDELGNLMSQFHGNVMNQTQGHWV